MSLPEFGRRYTSDEKGVFERQGWEFTECTLVDESDPMWIISGKHDPQESLYGHEHDWMMLL